jgi:ribose-phosphate pyrophosphokinase
VNCAVFGFAEYAEPAGRLADALGVPFHQVAVRRFPDGESLVRVPATPRIAVLYRSLDHPNEKIVELLLAASALRDGGASRVVLVVPYLAYMRQDIAFRPGEAVSQRVVGRLIAQTCDALLTLDAHLHRVGSLAEVMPGIAAVSLSAAPVLAAALDEGGDPLLVGPDEESRQWVEAIARARGLEFLLGRKRRLGDCEVELAIDAVERAAGRAVVLVDDLVSSGATMKAAARLLRDAGAARIEALATHCLASAEDLEEIRGEGVSSLRATDSVVGAAGSLPVAGLVAAEIARRGWLD